MDNKKHSKQKEEEVVIGPHMPEFNYNRELMKRTGIFEFEQIVPSDMCDKIIKAFHDTDKKQTGTVGRFGQDVVNQELKISTDWPIDHENQISKDIYPYILHCIGSVSKQFPHLQTFPPFSLTQLVMQEKKKNIGFFGPHIDVEIGNKEHERMMAIIIYLNDVEEGGETQFYTPLEYGIKPQKGKILVFPSTWRYLHAGVPSTSNDKYILTCFLAVPRG